MFACSSRFPKRTPRFVVPRKWNQQRSSSLLVGPTDFLVGTLISPCVYCSRGRRPNSVLAASRYRDVLCDARGRRDGTRERHADSVFRPQNDHRTSFDLLARSQLKIVFSE